MTDRTHITWPTAESWLEAQARRDARLAGLKPATRRRLVNAGRAQGLPADKRATVARQWREIRAAGREA